LSGRNQRKEEEKGKNTEGEEDQSMLHTHEDRIMEHWRKEEKDSKLVQSTLLAYMELSQWNPFVLLIYAHSK
jgi:hypothetical protein